jgi:hypothetical protein
VKSRLLPIAAALCLSMVIIGAQPVPATPPAQSQPEWLARMLEDGWRQVQEGVLQRQRGRGPVETFTYGKKGLSWERDRLEERISRLEHEYGRDRSEKLGQVISRLKGYKAQTEARLSSSQPEPEPYTAATLAAGCDFSFGAPTSADPLADGVGVTATASAYFYGTCGYVGDTYAYAYARATAGTTTTTSIQEDPKYGGTWLDSSATASAHGSLDCYSEAYAHVVSTALGLDYSTTDTNHLCPNPPVAAINGQSSDGYQTVHVTAGSKCLRLAWTASATEGTSPYTFNWYIGTAFQGSGSTLTRTYCDSQTETVKLVATDSAGLSDDAYYTIEIRYEPVESAPCTSTTGSCS